MLCGICGIGPPMDRTCGPTPRTVCTARARAGPMHGWIGGGAFPSHPMADCAYCVFVAFLLIAFGRRSNQSLAVVVLAI
jgi:hypothetical protein